MVYLESDTLPDSRFTSEGTRPLETDICIAQDEDLDSEVLLLSWQGLETHHAKSRRELRYD